MDYASYLPAMIAARKQSLHSNDPDSKVGAVCVVEDDARKQYLGAASNVITADYKDRSDKLLVAAHAECMCIAAVREAGWPNLSRLTMVVTRHPCSQCMIAIWLSGCKKVVYLDRDGPDSKWVDSFAAAKRIAAKYHIDLLGFPLEAFNGEITELPLWRAG